MNKRLDEALMRVKALDPSQQQEAAEWLLEYLDAREAGVSLSPEQLAELEKCLADDEPFASEQETRAVFERLTK